MSVSESPLGAPFVLPPRYAIVASAGLDVGTGVALGATVGVGDAVGVGVGVGAMDTAKVAAGSLTE